MNHSVTEMSMLSTTTILLVWLGAMLSGTVEGFPSGAPNFACRTMRPNHPSVSQPAETLPVNIKLVPDRALPGDVIDVHVWVKNSTDRFKGMLVTARSLRDPDTPETGFINTNHTRFKLLNCTGSGRTRNALTHRSRLFTDRASFKWKVPDGALLGSTYLLRFTIVRNATIYWVGMNTTFTVGRPRQRPRARPEMTRPITAPSRLPGQGSASRMTSPVTGSRSGSNTAQTANNTNRQSWILPTGRPQTGQSPLNGQQTGSSQENRQQAGSPQFSGQPAALNGRAGPASPMNVRPTEATPTTGQSRTRQADQRQPMVDSRQSGRAPSVTGTAGRSPPKEQRPPSSPLGPPRAGTPSSGSSPQGTPARGPSQQVLTASRSRVPAGSTNTASQARSRDTGSGSQATPVGQQTLPASPARGLLSPAVEVGRPAAPQRNMVAGVPDPPAQRTNTLPGGQRREDRVWGTAGSGADTSGTASGSEGMTAWLAGWFGR